MHDPSTTSVPDLLSQHIEEALTNSGTRSRYSAFRTALAETLGVPRDDIGVGAVANVSKTLGRRLDEWRSTSVTVLILKAVIPSRINKEAHSAQRKVEFLLGSGKPPRRMVIVYGRQAEPESPAWTVKAVVEVTSRKERRTIADRLAPHYTHFDRTMIRDDYDRLPLGDAHEPAERFAVPPTPFTIEEAAGDLFVTPDALALMRDTLLHKKNLVLEGSPGVGKTFLARRLADAIVGERHSEQVQMVQFHPSYSYEDFVRGWRPGSSGRLELLNGIFLEFCQSASYLPSKPFVFIIDEINRGNLAKILGELLMLIEADKRDPSYAMPLAYTEQDARKFFVPPNVYVLGLMNTADRSLAMVDYALRRRFAFIQLAPAFEDERFVDYLARRGAPTKLIKRIQSEMTRINDLIASSRQLGPGFVIGHSYFVPGVDDAVLDDAWYASVVDTEIVPLLQEYWSDSPGLLEESLGILGKDTSG
jgi:MoxR-like ATPase